MADMKAKGRRKGVNAKDQNGRAVLTMDDAREIRRLLEAGMSQAEVGAKYGVHQGHISRIKLGKVWTEQTD